MQHPSVYTIGKRGSWTDFKVPPERLKSLGSEIVNIQRGGEVTFHGPGQLVLYPIVHLRRLQLGPRAYVVALEDIVVKVAAQYGLQAEVGQGS